jgi:hypothetical protein
VVRLLRVVRFQSPVSGAGWGLWSFQVLTTFSTSIAGTSGDRLLQKPGQILKRIANAPARPGPKSTERNASEPAIFPIQKQA